MKEKLGRPIYNLQTMLRLISQADNRILPVIPDGIYGPNTFASVQSYQKYYGLAATGIVDLNTWNSIVSQYNAVTSNLTPSDGLHLVQAMLLAVSGKYPDIQAPPVTGTSNVQTEAALQRIQKAADLPPSGTPTAETQQALRATYQSLA